MALSLSECFNVPEYSTHILNLKRIGGEAGSEGSSQVEASQGVRKGKRKRVTSDCSDAATMVHVNAAILGTKSEVLDCLLKSEMQGDSSVPSVTLQSEEVVELMCLLLKFCYCEDAIGQVAAHIEKLLALLMLADKFAVSACVQACVNILNKKSLKLEDASILLSLPDSLLQQKCLLPLIKTSRKALEKELVNLDELFATEQYLSLPLNVLRIALESSKARVHSENTVFCLVLGWVGKNCHGASARKAALEELLPLMRFGHMTGDFLLLISEQPKLATPLTKKLIKQALRFRMGREVEELWLEQYQEAA